MNEPKFGEVWRHKDADTHMHAMVIGPAERNVSIGRDSLSVLTIYSHRDETYIGVIDRLTLDAMWEKVD